MLNPNALSRRLADFTACFCEDRADFKVHPVKIHPLQAVMQTFGSAPCRVTARLLPCRLPWQFVPSLTALQLCVNYACWYKQSQIQNIKDKLAKMEAEQDGK